MTHIVSNVMTVILVLNFIFAVAVIFLERKDTASTWAWLLVLTFIPIVGFLLYVFLGRGISKERIFDLQMQKKLGLKDEIAEQIKEIKEGTFPFPETNSIDPKELIYMVSIYDDSLFTTNNEVDLFTDGTKKFEQLLKDIETATHHIHLQYYIYRSDQLGKTIRNALIDAAKRGVQVRVLIDAWGSTSLKRNFFKPLEEAGGEVETFFPILVPYLSPRLQYRNHRKIVVIDGKIGYTGGFNVGDEYLGVVKKFGYWRDNHVRIVGDAVYALQNRFLMDWNSQHKPKLLFDPAYFPLMVTEGDRDIQIVTSGPDSTMEQIKLVYLKMINMAKKEILIQTPYYIPDDSIHEALKLALLSGVKVRLQIPNKPDHILVYWATYSFAAELLNYGATVETYEKGFMHSKTIVIDGEITSLGSTNFDNRSFRLDFEVNAIFYDIDFSQKVREAFIQDSQHSQVLTKEIYAERGLLIKIKEGLARLISPLL
ncbi:cardiolipin synthase [Vagococcus humatus]|nr:cardiolipin synthase [Vagococcus humatus]